MDSRKTIIVCKVKDHDVQYQRGMGSFDFVLWSEVKRDTVLPLFEFSVKFANSVEQSSVGLL